MAPILVSCTIRSATLADTFRLTAFGRRVFMATFAPDNDAAQLASYVETAYVPEAQAAELSNPDITTLLACDDDDAIIGFAQLRGGSPPPCVADLSAIELWRFYVDPAWHGQGVAASPHGCGDRSRAAAGARTFWLGVWERNLRAQAFYRKHGFTPVGSQIFMFGTEPQTDQIWIVGL